VGEDAFEVRGCETFSANGPLRARTTQPPLKGRVYLAGMFESMSRKVITDLSERMGLTLVSDADVADTRIMFGLETSETEIRKYVLDHPQACVLPCTWLLDCISSYRNLNQDEYRVKM
jgi:hypothetical protein